MPERTLTLKLPEDTYEPGRRTSSHTAGHLDVEVWATHLSVERFYEIVKAKAGKVFHACYSSAHDERGWGATLAAVWMEDGAKVTLHGPTDWDYRTRKAAA